MGHSLEFASEDRGLPPVRDQESGVIYFFNLYASKSTNVNCM